MQTYSTLARNWWASNIQFANILSWPVKESNIYLGFKDMYLYILHNKYQILYQLKEEQKLMHYIMILSMNYFSLWTKYHIGYTRKK